MIEVPVRSVAGEVVRQMQLDERVWGITPNTAVVHQAVVTQLANQRKGTHATKTRGMVAGGGRKPWRQKGTGRARQGSTRAPHWRGGGIVFGPHPRSYHKDLPRKMRRLAMRSALSAKVQDGELVIVDQLTLPAARTREMAAVLARLGTADSALIVLGSADEAAKRAAANLPKIRTALPGSTNLLDVLNHHWLLMTVEAVEALTRTLAADLKPATANGGTAAPPASASAPGPAPTGAGGPSTASVPPSAAATTAPASGATPAGPTAPASGTSSTQAPAAPPAEAGPGTPAANPAEGETL